MDDKDKKIVKIELDQVQPNCILLPIEALLVIDQARHICEYGDNFNRPDIEILRKYGMAYNEALVKADIHRDVKDLTDKVRYPQ